MKLSILIKAKPNGHRERTVVKIEPLTLDTLAEPNNSGKWTSYSVYLGNKVTGRYDAEDPDDPSYPPIKLKPRGPIGLFFDDLSTPFLVLDGFQPTKLAKRGWGRFIRVNRQVETMEVEWSQQQE